ncbi:hypothetical protein E4U60_003741 [Claviceps pazoutovae]|uniref:Ethionine resistance protein n=1 Tax=Claviceps pazoutovae TaxID=1649127 RepID=A0A9P7MJL1_9HYPO|nr:hypothetical protein E4U60_003741 [Claviceps pazoutovae]
MVGARPVIGSPSGRGRNLVSASVQQQYLACSPLAERFLADDIAACPEEDRDIIRAEEGHDDDHSKHPGDPMCRRPSGVAYGGSRPVFNDAQPLVNEPMPMPMPMPTPPREQKQVRRARSLLRDFDSPTPKQTKPPRKRSLAARMVRRVFNVKKPRSGADAGAPTKAPATRIAATETAPLLVNADLDNRSDTSSEPDVDSGSTSGSGPATGSGDDDEQPWTQQWEQPWEQPVPSRHVPASWQRETRTIISYSMPLIVTFFLQYSINVASVFAVGRIGKVELGAVSLANMSQAISCLAPFQGLATSLDTLCAQAYGSGHKHLVGLQCQRMACFLLCLSVPVAVLWLFAESILIYVVPDAETARLAALYLRVMIFSIPGLVLFEVGKRFTQAQGLFRATTYVLIVAAPVNIFINWLLVWKLGWGFIGAPIAVAITETLLPILLFLYVVFIDGRQCWGGFSRRALSNWWVMIRLALPGMIMVEAEWLAFEIMTLLSGRFGTEYLAAQSVLVTLSSISYQIPFPMSIAASTRVANLMGAGLVDAAKITGKVTFVAALLIGLLNLTVFSALRFHLPLLFTNDPGVIQAVARVLPVVAVMQVFDGLGAGAHGLLRGIGKQSIGGPANLISYYVISLPVSLALAFGLDWKLEGLWAGVTVGLIIVSIIEYTYLLKTDWHKAALEAEARNAAG